MAHYLSLRKAASLLGVHHATLSRAVRRGELRPEYVTPGGFMRFSVEEVERYGRERLRRKAAASPDGGADFPLDMAALLRLPNVEEVLESMPHLARRLVGARYAALAIMTPEGQVVKFCVSGLDQGQVEAIGDPPAGRGLLGALFREARPIRIPDIAKDPRSSGFPPGHPPMKSLLGVPVVVGGASVGNLYLTDKLGAGEFTEEDQRLVEQLSRHAAMALENARLYAREMSLREAAERERRQLMAIIESSAAAVVVVDAADGSVVLANQEAERLLGLELRPGTPQAVYERAAIYRRPDGSPYPLEELPLQRALRGETSQNVEVLFDLPDGRRIPTLVNAAPVRDAAGQTVAAVAIFEDITALQEVERLKADFLSMITHDLRGPLATIKGLSSSLLMENGPRDMDTVLEYVNSIDEEVDRMTELVGNLLDMSRIEANVMPMDPELCHLADIVSECVHRVENSRMAGRHTIVVDVPLELPDIYADYDQISRVVTNLLSNAIKYSPEGTEIHVRSYIDPRNPARVVTEVKDQGVGIPPHEMDKIFDKFYRVTSQRGRSRPGSGLGLAICKAIVEAHDGEIWVDSAPGKGSTFYFSLPASVAGV